MSYIDLWIHVVWGTKNRQPLLTKDVRPQILEHIRQNARLKDIYLDTIGGYVDHVHVLISVRAEQSVARIVQLLKGESSYWVNKLDLKASKFEWADEYYAASVSRSNIDAIRNYIRKQEDHHGKKSFAQEYEDFMKSEFPALDLS